MSPFFFPFSISL